MSALKKRGGPWTEQEHYQFLMGLEAYGKGDWRSIARNCVVSRSPSQVASHAQKYFMRHHNDMKKTRKRKKGSSILDITSAEMFLFGPVQSYMPQGTMTVTAPGMPVFNAQPYMVATEGFVRPGALVVDGQDGAAAAPAAATAFQQYTPPAQMMPAPASNAPHTVVRMVPVAGGGMPRGGLADGHTSVAYEAPRAFGEPMQWSQPVAFPQGTMTFAGQRPMMIPVEAAGGYAVQQVQTVPAAAPMATAIHTLGQPTMVRTMAPMTPMHFVDGSGQLLQMAVPVHMDPAGMDARIQMMAVPVQAANAQINHAAAAAAAVAMQQQQQGPPQQTARGGAPTENPPTYITQSTPQMHLMAQQMAQMAQMAQMRSAALSQPMVQLGAWMREPGASSGPTIIGTTQPLGTVQPPLPSASAPTTTISVAPRVH